MICRIIRIMISFAADERRETSAFVKRHLKNCPDCRRFHAASQNMAQRLAGEARKLTVKPDFRVHAPAPRSVNNWRPVWAGALGIALLAAVLFTMTSKHGAESLLPPSASRQSVGKLSQLPASINRVFQGDITMSKRSWINPEMALLQEDARDAARYLLQTFPLPTQTSTQASWSRSGD